MCDCGSGSAGAGPFATGRALVEFVIAAHGGELVSSPLQHGALQVNCQGCQAEFTMKTFVQSCPACGGVHAVSPPRANDPSAVQFAGADFVMP
jgi:hypothetical protein